MVDKDALFDELSKEFPSGKYTTFCNKMGFSYNEAQSVLTRFKEHFNVALRDLLSQWDLKMKGVTRKQLEDALDGADVGGLCSIVDKHYKKASTEVVAATRLVVGDGAVHGTRNQFINQPDISDSVHTDQGDIFSKKISASLTVKRCREKLENKYLNQLCKIQMKPWDQSDYAEFKDMHTVVTMVKKDARGQDTKKDILQGSVAKIFSTKVNGRPPARILISAPAGRGKTTAVAKMAFDWVHKEKGSALELLPLLFVVKFRNTTQRTSIGEAIKSQLLSDVDDLTPEGLESFIRDNQGICHIILDGLDEYAGISSSNRSSESNMVSVIRWEEFPECRVLVTTRPHLENFFNQDDLPTVYTKMWIEGFSQEGSYEYIDKFFASTSNPRSGHDLKVYLNDQPLINELAKTPLFCLMVCHLWSDGHLNTETATQTELLDNVNVFLMHHANARSKSKGSKITDRTLGEIIRKLGKVALAGLLDDSKKLVFTPHDFQRVPSILDRACELGIISQTTVTTKTFPRSYKTTSITIEFYHKLAQEHSAGKYLAAQAKSRKYQWPWQTSNLDRVLLKINANIGDYENLIRFAAGTDSSLCIRIMEALLSNSYLDESERYRILLDCSSETKGAEGNVSSFVQRCITAQSIVLKSPTVYTVVGMLNLPMELKHKVRTVKFEGSTLTTDVTSGIWSCLNTFLMLDTLIISDSSLSFSPSPPELLSVTKLSAERVTSQSYEGVLSSIPGVRDIDVSIDVAETSNTFQITTASLPKSQTMERDEQSFVHIRLHAWPALTKDRKIESGETIGGLSLLFECQTKHQHRLHVSGVKDRDEETMVDLFVKTKRLTSFKSGSGGGSLNEKNAVQNTMLEIQHCQLSSEMTENLCSYLRSFTSLNQLSISDSSLSFPPHPPQLPSVSKLIAKRVTSQSFEDLLLSLPGLGDIDITIDDAERDIPQITACLCRTGGQQLTHITITAPSSLPSEKNSVSRETMRALGLLISEQTKNLQCLRLSGIQCSDEKDLVELVESSAYLKSLDSLHLQSVGCGSFNYDRQSDVQINNCQLSSEMTARLWYCLRSFTLLNSLDISESSLSFPPSPPVLPSVTELSAERVTSQSYEGLLSSLPGLRDIDITIDDAGRDISQITAGVRRTGGQQLTRIKLTAPPLLPPEKSRVSRETMRGLGLLIKTKTKNLQWLCLSGVKCRDEEYLVDIIECCRRVKTMSNVLITSCGNREGGSLQNYLRSFCASTGTLDVRVLYGGFRYYRVPHTG